MDSVADDGPGHEPAPAGIRRLPVEIMAEIVSDLVLEDILACARVSRHWRAAWTQPAVSAALCHRFFPTQPRPQTFATFQKACRMFFRRRHGKHAVVDLSENDWVAGLPLNFEPDPKVHPDGQYPELAIKDPTVIAYGGGNVVWNSGVDFLLIDTIYTRKRRALRSADWNFMVDCLEPYECAVSESLLVLRPGVVSEPREVGYQLFVYHLTTNLGILHIIHGLEANVVDDWLSIRTWGQNIFVTTGPSTTHVLSHDGASISLAHAINLYDSLGPEWHGFARPPGCERVQHRTNFLPNPYDAEGVFVIVAGAVLPEAPKRPDEYNFLKGVSVPESGPECTHFLVREYSGSGATYIATYVCDIWETMRAVMQGVFGTGNEFVSEELTEARERLEAWDCEWQGEKDEWPGVYGSDEGVHEVFRFVFKARDITGPKPVHNWKLHYQASVTFNTVSREFGVQRALIDDGEDLIGDYNDDWIPRASILRNQQLLRVYYDSYKDDSMPIITTRDLDVGRNQKTRRILVRRDDLYPLSHENKGWSKRGDQNIHLRVAHDEDFTVLINRDSGDCVAFDFSEQGCGGKSREETGQAEL